MNAKAGWVVGIVVVLIVIALGVMSFLSWQNPAPVVGTIVRPVSDMIHINEPLPNVLVQSPLVVKGEARGSWYFEASFPVKILDANGKQLGVVLAQAQGDWMTTNFVPFQASLVFDVPTTETGTVVFQKDNPSGLAANDVSVSIPVYFSANASKL